MPNRRPLNLDEFNISKNEYYKILYHCRDYDKKKLELKECYSLSASGNGARGGTMSDPTLYAAMRASKLSEYIETIESAAKEADPAISQWILLNVTNEHMTYEKMNAREHIPCGKEYFYKARRRFFWIMSQRV